MSVRALAVSPVADVAWGLAPGCPLWPGASGSVTGAGGPGGTGNGAGAGGTAGRDAGGHAGPAGRRRGRRDRRQWFGHRGGVGGAGGSATGAGSGRDGRRDRRNRRRRRWTVRQRRCRRRQRCAPGRRGRQRPGGQRQLRVGDGGSPSAGPAGPWARGVSVGLVEVTAGCVREAGRGGRGGGARDAQRPAHRGPSAVRARARQAARWVHRSAAARRCWTCSTGRRAAARASRTPR